MSGARCSLALSVALLLASCASPTTTPEARDEVTIAFLRAVGSATSDSQDILLGELRSVGFDPGSNLTILSADPAIAYPDPEDAAEIVAEWVDEGVDLIFALSSSGAMAAAQAAPAVPVLFISNDPTATGLVQNESQPEANLTGVTFRVPADRTLSIAARAIPRLSKVGLVYPAEDPAALPHADAVEEAAISLGLKVEMANFTDETDAAAAVDRLVDQGVGAIFISNSPTAIRALQPIQEAADAAGVPTIANTDLSVRSLVVLGPNSLELNRQLGRQAARILAGSDVVDVPVEDPREFRLILNSTVADELSIVLERDLVREADRVAR